MTNYNNLRDGINSFQKGLFYNLSNQHWGLPNGIAHLLEADDTGCCWFLFHINAEQAAVYEEECPANIRLYEKGREYYIEASGKAVLLRDPEEWTKCSKITYGLAKALRYHGVIVRFRIHEAKVVETGRSSRRNFWQRLMDQTSEWIFGNSNAETIYPARILSH